MTRTYNGVLSSAEQDHISSRRKISKKVPEGTKLNWSQSPLGKHKPHLHWEGREFEPEWEPPVVWDTPRAEWKSMPTGSKSQALPKGDARSVYQVMREERHKAANAKWVKSIIRKLEGQYAAKQERAEVHEEVPQA